MIYKNLEKLEFNIALNQISEMCVTDGGKKLALNLLPYKYKKEVEHKLHEIEEATNLIHLTGDFPLLEIKSQTVTLKKLRSSISLSCKELLEIAQILKTARLFKNYLKTSEYRSRFLKDVFDNLYSNKDIEKLIFKCIISENEIYDKASVELSSIRRKKNMLELNIRNKLSSIIHSGTLSKYLMESVITIRNSRFVIPVKEEYRSMVKGFVHDTSSSGSTLYIEPVAIFDMNNSINTLVVEETKEIEKILLRLSEKLFPIVDQIENTISSISYLDFVNAKANLIIKHDYICPVIGDYINLKKARHPLIDVSKAVPIDINIGNTGFSTLVITGPNTGGKTVTLKTVGLLCAMAQSGIPIPASDGSVIKLFDNIFADIGDEQSIEESLSTFSSHIKNIVEILDNYSKDSLILLDELGAGTDPIEGASLAISLLETFHLNGAMTIATTHYHEIKKYCLTHDGFENASVEFDIHTLSPTYHLLIGIPGKSNAFEICNKLGVPETIINRASSLISKPDYDIEEVMKQIFDDKIETEKIKNEIQKNLNQAESLRKSLEKQHSEKLIREKEKVEKAKKEARDILLEAKQEANRIIRELNSLDSNDVKKANKLRNELNDLTGKVKGDVLDLSVLLKLNQKESSPIAHFGTVHIQNTKAKNISTEINLLGETVSSAIIELEHYLDNCKMAGLHRVRVVHGKGTGKLREGIHKYLKTSKYVESFRIGDYGEGDYGVTIVTLKK